MLRLPKETALISGQGRTHDFPGIPFASRGHFSENIYQKAAFIHMDVPVLYTKPTYCCEIQDDWELAGRREVME